MSKRDCYHCNTEFDDFDRLDPDGLVFCSQTCQKLFEEGSLGLDEYESFAEDEEELYIFNRRNNPNE